jgi:hypothetical protein
VASRRAWAARLPAACGLLALTLAILNFISHPLPATAAAAAAATNRRIAEDAARRRAAAHEWQQAWRRPPDRRVALLHKASDPITLRGVQAAARAKKEVEAAGGWYGFVYSLYPADLPAGTEVPLSERQRITLGSLRAALGNASVFVVGRDQVRAGGARDGFGSGSWRGVWTGRLLHAGGRVQQRAGHEAVEPPSTGACAHVPLCRAEAPPRQPPPLLAPRPTPPPNPQNTAGGRVPGPAGSR